MNLVIHAEMADSILPPEAVAKAFVDQYYLILELSPENAHRFYQESSLLGWQDNDGLVAPATTLNGINEKIMSSDFKNGKVETLTVDAQESLSEGVFVAVSGLWTSNDNMKRKFRQSFFLARQDKGYYVLNDILRFSNSSELTTISAVNDDYKLSEAPSVPNAVLSTAVDNNASNTEEAVKKEGIKESIDPSVSKDVDAKVTVTTPLSPLREKVSPIKPAADAKVEAPKITYASVVAKASPPTSPKAVKGSSNVDSRAIAPLATKTSAPRVDVAQKAPASSSCKQVSKASIPLSNVGPKSSVVNNGAPNANPEARAIYIGGLPHDVTKQGVAEVMKTFGPLRRSPDSVQLKKHDDGFCCGFVEFESADAARRAVEVRHVQFGDKEAYCSYRRNPNQGNDGRGRSPSRGRFQNGNFRGRENGEVGKGRRSQSGNRSGHYSGQARGARQN